MGHESVKDILRQRKKNSDGLYNADGSKNPIRNITNELASARACVSVFGHPARYTGSDPPIVYISEANFATLDYHEG